MKPVQQSILKLIKQYPNYPIVVAYSGGLDSQVLLHTIYQLSTQTTSFPKVYICHVHHGLSPNADSWLSFAEQVCSTYGFSLTSERVVLDIGNGESLEAQARTARYQVLKNVSTEPALIVTGHHLDDQAESFLLALKRGAGLKGLSAMAHQINLDKHILARPMLSVSRDEIHAYATEHRLTWINDESNGDSRFDRNFLRNEILPLINERWPAFNNTVARSAVLCQENQQLIDEIAATDFASAKQSDHCLSLDFLSTLSVARFNNVIRYSVAQLGGLMPSQAQLAMLFSQLNVQQDKSPEIKIGQLVARRFNGNLYLTPVYKELSTFEHIVCWNDFENKDLTVRLPDNLGKVVFSINPFEQSGNVTKISLPKDSNILKIVFSHQNPKVTPEYRQHSRSLKKVLQELRIAPWLRKRIPFIFAEDELVSALGYFVCKPYLSERNEKVVYVSWLLEQ